MSFRPDHRLAPLILLLGLLLAACSPDPPEPTATATPKPPTATPTATRVPPTPTPTPSPTPVPEIAGGAAVVIGGELRARSQPNAGSDQTGTLANLQSVQIARTVRGQNWLAGGQSWVGASPAWASEWYELADGSFVYAAFVFVLGPEERSPLQDIGADAERWIDVDISEQRARAMVGEEAVFTAGMSSGARPFETPRGSFQIQPDGRIAVEKMTAAQAGYAPDQAQYDVERVLFTQYFDQSGNALHLNYWRPASVFGRTPTSHGCIGLEMHAAQYFWLFAAPGMRVEVHD